MSEGPGGPLLGLSWEERVYRSRAGLGSVRKSPSERRACVTLQVRGPAFPQGREGRGPGQCCSMVAALAHAPKGAGSIPSPG